MATKTRPQGAMRRKPNLTAGFDSLTLDPSPRLRRTRERVARESQATIGSAWKYTGQALAAAMISVSRTFASQARANPPRSSKPYRSS
jgi:hypothetical protein